MSVGIRGDEIVGYTRRPAAECIWSHELSVTIYILPGPRIDKRKFVRSRADYRAIAVMKFLNLKRQLSRGLVPSMRKFECAPC
jgi:hypothetical protein